MPSVTVPGTAWSGTFNNANNFALAQQIANSLVEANRLGNLVVTQYNGGTEPPPPTPGKLNELVLGSAVSGQMTVPGGSDGTGYVVVVDTDQPMTITGSANMSILGGTGQVTVIDPGAVALADTNSSTPGANSTVNLMPTDIGAVVAGNDGNDQMAAFGANQSIAGGTGSNNMFALGSGDTISAIGSHDTISGGSSAATYMNSGTNALMFAAVGGGAIFDTGEQSTIVGSSGTLAVTTGGGRGVLFGGSGDMSVTDSGTATTIVGGSGAATVTATGSGELLGQQTGNMMFVGGDSASTVFGSAGSSATVDGGSGGVWYTDLGGSSTVFGGSGISTLFGGAGGSMVYGGSVGGAQYMALSGSETINAAGSSSGNLLVAGADPNGHDRLIGGSGNDTLVAGAASSTMTGGAGNNDFVFFRDHTAAAGNINIVTDFNSNDVVLLQGYGSGQAATALASAVTSSGSTTLTLSDNTKITFVGLSGTGELINHIASA